MELRAEACFLIAERTEREIFADLMISIIKSKDFDYNYINRYKYTFQKIDPYGNYKGFTEDEKLNPWFINKEAYCKMNGIVYYGIIMQGPAPTPEALKGKTLGDFDIWYLPCDRCGHDTGRSRKLDDARCWKCGNRIRRDYTERALKKCKKS